MSAHLCSGKPSAPSTSSGTADAMSATSDRERPTVARSPAVTTVALCLSGLAMDLRRSCATGLRTNATSRARAENRPPIGRARGESARLPCAQPMPDTLARLRLYTPRLKRCQRKDRCSNPSLGPGSWILMLHGHKIDGSHPADTRHTTLTPGITRRHRATASSARCGCPGGSSIVSR